MDRGGCFLGTLTLKGAHSVNLGLALLSQGLAKLQVSFDPVREQQGRELVSTEKEARDKCLKASLLLPEGKSLFKNARFYIKAPSSLHVDSQGIVMTQCDDA